MALSTFFYIFIGDNVNALSILTILMQCTANRSIWASAWLADPFQAVYKAVHTSDINKTFFVKTKTKTSIFFQAKTKTKTF